MIDRDTPIPPLRQSLEAVPVEDDGKPLYLLRDLEGLSSGTVGISEGGMLIISLLDGKRTAADIGSLFAKSTGTILKQDEILGLIKKLEEAGFLEDQAAKEKRALILKEFLENPVRKAVHKGTAYSMDTLELAKQFGGYINDAKGPRKGIAEKPTLKAPPAGLVVPHIDFQRGGPAYAWAYQALSECPPPDLILAFGVAHSSPNSPWIMTQKAYETPHGPMNVSQDLYNDVKKTLWYDSQTDEWAHRTEHSLEFQAVWLKHLWKDKTPPWVPILCSSFERFCPDKPPSTVASIEDALNTLGVKLEERRKKGQTVMVLAAVDLAHVGPRFGDTETLGPELEKRIETEDRKSLEHAMALKADDFYLSVVADGHWRKVCGLSALYTSLRLIKAQSGGAGKLLTYAQAPDPMGGVVSFAGAIFPGQGDKP